MTKNRTVSGINFITEVPQNVNLGSDLFSTLPIEVQEELKRISVSLTQLQSVNETLMSEMTKLTEEKKNIYGTISAANPTFGRKGNFVSMEIGASNEFVFSKDTSDLFTVKLDGDKLYVASMKNKISVSLDSPTQIILMNTK